MSDNPYESPQAEAGTVNPLSGRVLTESMLFYLKGAAPWLRFIGIVGFICLGISILSLLLLVSVFSQALEELPEAAPYSAFLSSGMVFIYLPFLALYFFPVLYLFRFGKKIQNYLLTGDSGDLEAAFKNNKSLWKFVGILMIIMLGFFALALVIGIIAAFIGIFAG